MPSAGNVSLGAPGAAGSPYGKWRLFAASIGASQAVTIGAAAVDWIWVAGGNGGTTSLGALVSAPGRINGSILNNQVLLSTTAADCIKQSNGSIHKLFVRRGWRTFCSSILQIGGAGGLGGPSSIRKWRTRKARSTQSAIHRRTTAGAGCVCGPEPPGRAGIAL